MTDTRHLKLVSTFSNHTYPYLITKRIENPYNSADVETAALALREAVSIAGITKYKLFEQWDCIELHLRNETDFNCAEFALTQPRRILATFDCADTPISARLLKKRCKIAEETLGRIVPGPLTITANPEKAEIKMLGCSEAFIIAAKMQTMPFILNRRNQGPDAMYTPSTAARNSPPTPGKNPYPLG